MLTLTPEKLDWTVEEMAACFAKSRLFRFVAETCPACHARANVLFSQDWLCRCQSFNRGTRQSGQYPFDAPDIGPTAHEILLAKNQA